MITFKNRIMKKIKTKALGIIVSLLAISLGFVGCSDDDLDLPPVTAGFTFNVNQENGTVAFTNTSQNADNFIWDFGDDNTSTLSNPTNTFANGEFTVTLTASNVAGSTDTAQETIVINVATDPGNPNDNGEGFDSGLLTSGDFEGDNSAWFGGGLNIVTENGNNFQQVNVEAAGNPFDVNISQLVDLVEGTTYELSFDASSSTSQTILAGIGLNVDPFTNNSQPVALTTDLQRYTLTLTAAGFGGIGNRVLFDMGAAIGVVTIDNASLVINEEEVVQPPSDFDSGLLVNGDFETGISPWIIGVDDNAPAPSATDSGNTFYSVNVEAVGNPFDVNLSQKLEIIDGSTYTITFDAWSDRNRSILAGIGLSGGDFSANSESVAINTTRNTYSVTLTANGFGASDARVLFDSGAELGIVNIDNVSLTVDSSGVDMGGNDMVFTGGCDGELVAATSLPLDFEGCETFPSNINFGNGLTSALVDVTTIPNVTSTAANPSGFALQVDKPTGSDFFAGIQNIFASNFDLTTTNTFRMNVLSTKANVVFRLELLVSPNDGSIGNPTPVFVTIPTANTWTEIEFTFENLPASPTTYNQLVIKPDNDMADSGITNGGTYYIDDLRLE